MSIIPFGHFNVLDRGVPNQERICFKALQNLDLGKYFVGLGITKGPNLVDPINDNSFWLGKGFVSTEDWIFLYTGVGTPRANDVPNQPYKIYTMHWGRQNVLFRSAEIVPFIYSIDGIFLLTPTPALPNYAGDTQQS